MKRILLLCAAIVLFAATAAAQKDQKPWTEWNEKDTMKMLTDSAWSQTQKEVAESGSSGPAITTAAENRSSANMVMNDKDKASSQSGESMGRASFVQYSVAFLSAKPIREGFIRLLELKNPDTPADKVTERRGFVDRDFGDYIVVALKLDGNDMKKIAPARQLLNNADAMKEAKDTAYLERKDGKRVALMDYRAPDMMGAKFIFPRSVDGKPFLDANSGEVRVYIEVGKTKLNRRFKVADMMYDGKLEY
ncbi:MAG TPA: hypothetical protein VE961_20085 [Pyrinomonadaceae bacterium]|nr:hypothetical protein [Pyrinomonadaceae bacterium]